jgi:hypothetical protein
VPRADSEPASPGRGSLLEDAFEMGDLSLAKRFVPAASACISALKEDTGDGTTVKVKCPTDCLAVSSTAALEFGTVKYVD